MFLVEDIFRRKGKIFPNFILDADILFSYRLKRLSVRNTEYFNFILWTANGLLIYIGLKFTH